MPSFEFYAGENTSINNLSGSGLGFYGPAGFGDVVPVGDYASRCFITSSTGTTQGSEADNVKFFNIGSGVLGQTGSGIALLAVPNERATLRIRFTHTSAVQVQNVKLYCYDRTNKNNSQSGVTMRAAEIIHPDSVQTANGSGDSTWSTIAGSGSVLNLCPSPGPSGFFAGNGSNSAWADSVHDWHTALSPSPDSIGSKTLFGLWVELEYF